MTWKPGYGGYEFFEVGYPYQAVYNIQYIVNKIKCKKLDLTAESSKNIAYNLSGSTGGI